MDITVILDKYQAGTSLAKLSKELGISTYRLRKILVENNIHIRSKEEQNKYSPQNQRKYYINDNYFSELNNDNCYLLGFLAADGSIQKDGSIKIGLSSVDKDFLEMIKKSLESNYPIREYQTKDGFNISEFVFRSEKIKNQLQNYGIINRKTYSFEFPKNLPEQYWLDFIRGYFDGDGTFCLSGSYIRSSLCGYNQNFLQDVINILYEKYDIPKVKIYKDKRNNVYYFQYSQHSSEKLYRLFYKEKPNLYLPRKYLKCIQLFGEIISHEPVTSQVEEKII